MDLEPLLKYGTRDQPSLEGAPGVVFETTKRVASLP